jgi:hypothetical protein
MRNSPVRPNALRGESPLVAADEATAEFRESFFCGSNRETLEIQQVDFILTVIGWPKFRTQKCPKPI